MSARTKNRARKDDLAAGQSRLCAVLRQSFSTDELIRFVPSPDGIIVADLARRLPGRGVWLSCDRKIVAKAIATKAFQRSLKQAINIPDDLPDLIDRLLRKRVIESLALANKAGLVIAGFAKVDAALARGHVVALVHANDASEAGSCRLNRKFMAIQASAIQAGARQVEAIQGAAIQDRARQGAARQAGAIQADNGRAGHVELILSCLTIDELSLALGRSNVVHAALMDGGAALRLMREAHRLHRYRGTVSIEGSAANAANSQD